MREFARAGGRLAKTGAIDAAKDFSGPRYRTEIVALQLRMLGSGLNGTAPKAEASEKVTVLALASSPQRSARACPLPICSTVLSAPSTIKLAIDR